MERQNAFKWKNQPVTLVGPELKAGDKAPDFKVVAPDDAIITLKDTPNKIRIFSAVPSLNTGVCSAQTKRFDEELAKLGDAVACYTFSMDLPFLQGWFCTTNNIKLNKTVSDHREASFGAAYGVLIKELRLLSRAVFVLDPQGVIRYAEYVPDAPIQPNYDQALSSVKSLLVPTR